MNPIFTKILSDSSKITIEIATEVVGNNPDFFKKVLDLSLKPKSPLNIRAARVVVAAAENYYHLFLPYINSVVKRFPDFKTDGQKRAFAYLLSKYIDYIREDKHVEMLDVCFRYMFEDENIAVKYNCMIFLYETAKIYPELKGELKHAIDFNLTQNIFKMNGEVKKIYKEISQ